MPITFGLPEEQKDFTERNKRFLEVFPRLREAIGVVFSRQFEPANEAELVVFVLGRLMVEDFMEILLNCANGYGMAGLKLLRPMFEALVTAFYIARHPEEARVFLEYHHVHQRKTFKIAEAVGVDLSDRVSNERQAKVEEAYQRIKDHYRQVVCSECGTTRELASWTQKDLITLAREVGLARPVLGLYFLPTLQIHTTPTRIMSRLEETPSGFRFKEGPQRREADAALVGAHVCLALILEEQNRYFGLGLAGLEEGLRKNLEYAWPTQAAARLGASAGGAD